jgi:hypothetical protein
MISVILNVYKRPHLLEKQIQAIKNQSVPIKSENIHTWFNKSDEPQTYPMDEKINTYVCNWNTKFWGRFTLPLLMRTPYIAMFDDDTIPKKHWFKNCLDTIENPATNGILGGSGVILHEKGYKPHHKIGWNELHSDKAERVDLVGHAWFFRQEWAKYIFYEPPVHWDNGEDIMFSYLAQKYGKINTFVPPHPENNRDLWCNDEKEGWEIGNDLNASWRKGNHMPLRNMICATCIDNGWDTVRKIQK